jgi:shikimate dehydrogenase
MRITANTKLLGLIGWPVSHSHSPAMHNAAAAALALDIVYLPLAVRASELGAALKGLRALGFLGCNVTIPHKQAVMPFLDDLESTAQATGAVNSIVFERGKEGIRLIGYNTDGSGFLADLEAMEVDVAGRDCLILGSGGSARAIAFGLARSGGRVRLLARRMEQAEALVRDLSPFLSEPSHRLNSEPLPVPGSLADLATVCEAMSAPLIVNSTPVGMSPAVDDSIWPARIPFPGGSTVYDLVYNPAETRLIRQARSAGCQAANGVGMLLRQGAMAFQLWTGRTPDLSIMATAIQMG